MTLVAEPFAVGEVGDSVDEVGIVPPGEGWAVDVDEGSVTVMTFVADYLLSANQDRLKDVEITYHGRCYNLCKVITHGIRPHTRDCCSGCEARDVSYVFASVVQTDDIRLADT